MKVFTIGFRNEERRTVLLAHHPTWPVDARLNNVSQLAGFTKKNGLSFFLREINRIDYVHRPDLAPTKEIFDEYNKKGWNWASYEKQFMDLIAQRKIEEKVPKNLIDGGCLLRSESTP